MRTATTHLRRALRCSPRQPRHRLGPYDRCIRPAAWGDNSSPDCHACPILTAPPRELVTDADHVRVLDRITVCTVGDGPFATQVEQTLQLEPVDDAAATWTWAELARLPGWDIGRAVIDHRGPGFWLHRNSADQ
ncbi:hypothetical protein [Nocardia asteroides]